MVTKEHERKDLREVGVVSHETLMLLDEIERPVLIAWTRLDFVASLHEA